jgi:hypothetical protein
MVKFRFVLDFVPLQEIGRGCDRMVIGFTATYEISSYHYSSCEFESRSWRSVLDTTLCASLSVIYGRSVFFSGYSGFLHQ